MLRIVAEKWFPLVFALVQVLRHVGTLASDYWIAARGEPTFVVMEFVRRDLARPFFEPSGFCGGYSHNTFGQSTIIGL
jgi:hypothetical protein